MENVTPMMQWGFAGLCVILLGFNSWLVREFIRVIREQNDALVALTKETITVVRSNSEAVREVRQIEERQIDVLTRLHEQLLHRPCLLPKKEQ